MRSRLEGLFGAQETETEAAAAEEFDGRALRNAILERWGVQYDVQPQKRHGRVYVQVGLYFDECCGQVWGDLIVCACLCFVVVGY